MASKVSQSFENSKNNIVRFDQLDINLKEYNVTKMKSTKVLANKQLKNELKWNVWGGALIDKRNNQLSEDFRKLQISIDKISRRSERVKDLEFENSLGEDKKIGNTK